MELENIVLLFWDDPENFYSDDTQRRLGFGKRSKKSEVYKSVFQFNSSEQFTEIWTKLDENENLIFCCHVNYRDFSTYFEFLNLKIKEKFKIPEVIYLSSTDSGEVMHNLSKTHRIEETIILYSVLMDKIKLNKIKPFTKKDLIDFTSKIQFISEKGKPNTSFKVDYAIITALYEAEFEAIEQIVEFKDEEKYETATKIFHIGYLKENRSKKVVAAVPSATGMVDSAIIATQMLDLFEPNYLLMSGVCGGRENLNFGDIIIANPIFIFQKGKISDLRFRDKTGNQMGFKLFDEKGNQINYDNLFDEAGNKVSINIEKFEREHDTIIPLHSLVKDRIESKFKLIRNDINTSLEPFSKGINILMEPMACSTMVINRKGYFEDMIKPVHRKTAAVEMESYGVARACQVANNGKTIPIIFKSVMDKAENKGDDFKKFAAHTSAQFLKQLLLKEII